MRYSLLTIACMLAIGFITRYSGMMQRSVLPSPIRVGSIRCSAPCWAGSAWHSPVPTRRRTCCSAASRRITAEQLGLSPTLMSAANSAGGVMGKMIDAQSIVVASTATRWYGHEGDILRYVFLHSLVLAALVGVLVSLQAYVWPFSALVVR